MLGLFGFQFLNPKSWVMVLTATAAAQEQLARFQPFFGSPSSVVIPAACLALWSAFGSLLVRTLERPADPTVGRPSGMGLLLAGSALLLLAEATGMGSGR